MPLNLRDKLRAVDGPRRPTAPVKAEPVFRDCWHDSRVLPLDAVPGAWELPMEIVRLMEPGTLPAAMAAASSRPTGLPPRVSSHSSSTS